MNDTPRRKQSGRLAAAAAAALLGAACTAAPSEAERPTIERALAREERLLLDVRSPEEYEAGHLAGAVNVPVDEVHARLEELGARDRAVIVYCRSGRRSARAAGVLRDAGFTEVHDLGGMSNGPAFGLTEGR